MLSLYGITLKETETDKRFKYASELASSNKVKIISSSLLDEENVVNNKTTFTMEVERRYEGYFSPSFTIDLDGRVLKANCSCSFFRSNKLIKGPCDHIGASLIYISDKKNIEDYNIATGKTVSFLEVIKYAFKKKKLNYKKFVKFNKKFYRRFDIKENYADISKIKNFVKWKPQTDYKSLIDKLLN